MISEPTKPELQEKATPDDTSSESKPLPDYKRLAKPGDSPKTTRVDWAKEKIRRKSSTVPFGYKLHPDNRAYLVAIPLELEALRRARIYYKEGSSMSGIRRWIIKGTGRNITHQGLKKALLYREDF